MNAKVPTFSHYQQKPAHGSPKLGAGFFDAQCCPSAPGSLAAKNQNNRSDGVIVLAGAIRVQRKTPAPAGFMGIPGITPVLEASAPKPGTTQAYRKR